MKRISSATVTVFVMAILVGLVAAFVVKQAMRPQPQPVVEAPKAQTVPIVVAARNLPEHSVVKSTDLRVMQMPATRKVEGSLRNVQIAVGRIVKEAVKAGTPIIETNLHGIGETLPGLESRIPVGMRAMPINVDEQSVVAKMVGIGSHVDIALTVEGTHPDLGEMATRTLLHNVEVIAVEKPSASTRRGSAGNSASVITVAVSPADANMLINAEGTGKLDLTLCSPAEGDEQPVSIGGDSHMITRRELLGLSPIPPAPAPPKPVIIEKWEGGSVKMIKISQEHIEEAQRATAASKKFGHGKQVPVSTEASGISRPDAEASTTTVIEPVPVTTEVAN